MSARYFGKQNPPQRSPRKLIWAKMSWRVPLPLLPKQLITQSMAVLEYIFLKLKGVIMNTVLSPF